MAEKKCSKCGETKGFPEFNKRSSSKDGLNCQCKSCCRAYRETESAREKATIGRRKWKEANPERAAEHNRKWRESNPERHRESAKRCDRRKILKKAESSSSHTYLISDGEFLKIGIFTADKLQRRVDALQNGNPRKLKVLATSDINIEKLCHYEFEDLRVSGKWFKMSLELITFFTERA